MWGFDRNLDLKVCWLDHFYFIKHPYEHSSMIVWTYSTLYVLCLNFVQLWLYLYMSFFCRIKGCWEKTQIYKYIRILKGRRYRTLSTEGRTTSSLTFPADVWDGGPFGERCCQPRQTAAPGSAPDLTETSPSISHVIWVSEGVCALLAVTLTRRHKLFLSRCSLMHLSLIPPPYKNTKTNTCLPCSNYTCAHTLTRMCIMHFTKRLVNVKQRQTPLYFPLPLLLLLLFLSFYFWRGLHTDRDCCCEAERDRTNVALCKDGLSLWSGGRWGQPIEEPALEWRVGLEEFISFLCN